MENEKYLLNEDEQLEKEEILFDENGRPLNQKYALNLAEDGRILSATYHIYVQNEMPIVETLPEGNIYEYLYINGEYIHKPLPEPEQPKVEPTAQDDTDAMLIDHEYRLTLLELGITE